MSIKYAQLLMQLAVAMNNVLKAYDFAGRVLFSTENHSSAVVT